MKASGLQLKAHNQLRTGLIAAEEHKLTMNLGHRWISTDLVINFAQLSIGMGKRLSNFHAGSLQNGQAESNLEGNTRLQAGCCLLFAVAAGVYLSTAGFCGRSLWNVAPNGKQDKTFEFG